MTVTYRNLSKLTGRHFRPSRDGFAKTLLLVVLLIAGVSISGVWFLGGLKRETTESTSRVTYKVKRGEFVSSVVESGDIESSRNVEVRCEVKSKGRTGTTILKIVPEGTVVKKDDFIAQLDDSVASDELIQQKIQVAEDRARVIQAESDLDTARRMLHEYKNGTYQQELAALNAQVAEFEEGVRRAAEFRRHSETLSRKGYRTKTQLQADVFAEDKAKLDLQLAKQNLEVYTKFTRERTEAELGAEIKKQEANREASVFTSQLSNSRQEELQRELDNCRIVAPADGMVVYANETDRRGDASFVIEEGAMLRDGQPIVRLPDPTQMQVRTKVNDSKINDIDVGDPCLVRVDTDPETPIRAKVRKVSSFPMPRRWYQAPIEYEVFVDITEQSPLIRPGLRGKVEIFTERLQDVVQSPLTSVVKIDGEYFVFVKRAGEIQQRKVEIGPNNDRFVIIKSGLSIDEDVIVDADGYKADAKISSTP